MKKTIGLLAATLCMTSSAFAADLIVDEPAAVITAASYDWNGFYAGINGGFGAGNGDQEITFDALGYLDDDFVAVDISGGFIGGTAGFNVQQDNLVFGIEGDLAWANITGFTNPDGDPSNDGYETTIKALGTLRGRVGFASDALLIYGTAGLAAGSVDITNGDLTDNEFTPGRGASGNVTAVGYVVGAGVELGVAENLSIKAEYNYINLGSTDFVAPSDEVAADEEGNVTVSAHTVKVGLNYSF